MTLRKAFLSPLLICIVGLSSPPTKASTAEEEPLAPEVYRDQNIVVRAGIAQQDGQINHFGDVLALAIVVSWNRDDMTMEELGEEAFSAAWPAEDAPVLMNFQTRRRPGTGRFTNELQAVYRFQIVSCPGNEQTCPGDRQYEIPQFTVRYHTPSSAEPVAVNIQPIPQSLSIETTILLDDEGELRPFLDYFPMNAYPEPLTVPDSKDLALNAMGIGLLIFSGGILMWPFRFNRSNKLSSSERPRWQQLLTELQDSENQDERWLADRMRRCLVWYCSDSLNVDPFEWLPAAGVNELDESHKEPRDLFIDLLHDPSGNSGELRSRLTRLLHQAA